MPKQAFTLQTQNTILEAVRKGNQLQAAASLAGITKRTLQNWLNDARKEGERSKYYNFYVEYHKASATFDSNVISYVMDSGSPKDQLELLSRRKPNEWAATSKIMVAVDQKVQEILEYLVTELSSESYSEVLKALSKYEEETQ